jgi:hypothetical protein
MAAKMASEENEMKSINRNVGIAAAAKQRQRTPARSVKTAAKAAYENGEISLGVAKMNISSAKYRRK